MCGIDCIPSTGDGCVGYFQALAFINNGTVNMHMLVFVWTHFFVCVCFVFLPFLGPLPWHMEVPRLVVESEL